MFVIEGDDSIEGGRGSGKTTLAQTLIKLTGEAAVSCQLDQKSTDELATRLLSAEAKTARVILLDNIKDSRISSQKIEELLLSVELLDAADRQIRTYSKGMLQRLGLAQALINDPEILFLDEPLDGLDPLGRAEIKKIIMNLKSKNKTIFLNSHILSDVAELCDHVGIIDKGTLLVVDTPENISRGHRDLEDAFVSIIHKRRSSEIGLMQLDEIQGETEVFKESYYRTMTKKLLFQRRSSPTTSVQKK
jgi:ABC-type multidrug transport system ATPase subunit